MPIVTTCKSCREDFPSALEVGSLGSWQSLTVEDNNETCGHCGAANTYGKAEYRYEDTGKTRSETSNPLAPTRSSPTV